jgi:hypothetical protein
VPSLPQALVSYFGGCDEQNSGWHERLERSVRLSLALRRAGDAPNRTFLYCDWPADANKYAKVARKEWGARVEVLTGRMGIAYRRDACRDLDAFAANADLLITTSCVGLGTDYSIAFRESFFVARPGDCSPGPRALLQAVGRTPRDARFPFAPYTGPDGEQHAAGAANVLLMCRPLDDPAVVAARTQGAPRLARAKRLRAETEEHAHSIEHDRAAVDDAHRRANEPQYALSATILCPPATGARADARDAATLHALKTLDVMGVEDRQRWRYADRLLEYNAIPNKGFPVMCGGQLTDAQREELLQLRRGSVIEPQLRTVDQRVGEMDPWEQCEFVLDTMVHDADAGERSNLWPECYGMCPAGKPRHEGDNRDEALMTFWTALRHYRTFPKDKSVYMALYNDRDRGRIRHRAMLRYLDARQLAAEEGRIGRDVVDPMTAAELRPHYALPHLARLARVLRVDLHDLLEERDFCPTRHEWPAAHARLAAGKAREADEAMAQEARAAARALVKGIRGGKEKPTPLLTVVQRVLDVVVAVDCKLDKSSGIVRTTPVAADMDELVRVWHASAGEKLPLKAHAARWREIDDARRAAATSSSLDGYFGAMATQFADDLGLSSSGNADAATEEPMAVEVVPRYDPNRLFVPYDAEVLRGLVDDWRTDERERMELLKRLEQLEQQEESDGTASLMSDDQRRCLAVLRRLATRVKCAEALDARLPPPEVQSDGSSIRWGVEEYAHGSGAGKGVGRRYARDANAWKDHDGKWRSATAQGMPSNLFAVLVARFLRDIDGRASDPVVYVILAFLLHLPRSLVAVLVDEYLKDDETRDAWHRAVAERHGLAAADAKRWPNIFGNGGHYRTCLLKSGMSRADVERFLASPCETATRMEAALHKLRVEIARASMTKDENKDALWPGSHEFVRTHWARLMSERPELGDRERFNKVFSWLVGTAEDKILSVHMDAQRRHAQQQQQDHDGNSVDVRRRDTGVLAFDGLCVLRPADDAIAKAGDEAAEAAIEADGWSARPWGIRYRLVEKPMDRTDLDRLTREARALMRAQAEAEGADDGDGSQQPDADGWQLEIQTNHAEHVSMDETSGANE